MTTSIVLPARATVVESYQVYREGDVRASGGPRPVKSPFYSGTAIEIDVQPGREVLDEQLFRSDGAKLREAIEAASEEGPLEVDFENRVIASVSF